MLSALDKTTERSRMAVRIIHTNTPARLEAREARRLAAGAAHGRVTLVVPSRTERDLQRRALAEAGCGLGIDVTTPAGLIETLWELMGDGRRLASRLERRLIMAAVVDGMAPEDLAPLKNNPGTVRMLARIARDLLPFALDDDAYRQHARAAEQTVLAVLEAYRAALGERGLVEGAEAAQLMTEQLAQHALPCTACVAVCDVLELPAYLSRLLAAIAREGDVLAFVPAGAAELADVLERAYAARECDVVVEGGPRAADAPPAPSLLEVAGPHAKAAAYVEELERLAAGDDAAAPRRVAAISPAPGALFDELAARLAAAGLASSVVRMVRFTETGAGKTFASLSDIVERMRAADEGALSATEWWPAPELTDWLFSPFSGVDAASARAFDKRVRGRRDLGVEGVLRELQSVQGRVRASRAKLDAASTYAEVPVVCADCVQALWQGRPVTALSLMLDVARALPPAALGSCDGAARAAREQAALERALEFVRDVAHAANISQALAVSSLDELVITSRDVAAPEGEAHGEVVFTTLEDAALAAPGTYAGALLADVDVSSYPLAHPEGPLATMACDLAVEPVAVEPMVRLRLHIARVLGGAGARTVLARVSHDRQAKPCYPAAIWSELAARTGATPRVVGEGDLVHDADVARGRGLEVWHAACQPSQELSPQAVPYLVLKHRDEARGALMPNRFSASQIESYASCPLCWFVSSRVRPQALDAGFGNIEKGNFVHDVLCRFHERLIEDGSARVTPQNLEQSLGVLREVFCAVRAEHARGKTASSAALVALSRIEEAQIDDILPQLEGVVRFEARVLAPFVPTYLEYSFNKLDVTYAGWPLGGRIDRVDVDASSRAVVIDYKHRSGAARFKLTDPTVADKRTGGRPADDPAWLPEHTQTLIYATALNRALGLDVRGALYFFTKGTRPQLMGAVADELCEQERDDGRVPGVRDGFPGAGGSMGFAELLERVEAGVAQRLAALEAGCVRASDEPAAGCAYNHPFGFGPREG